MISWPVPEKFKTKNNHLSCVTIKDKKIWLLQSLSQDALINGVKSSTEDQEHHHRNQSIVWIYEKIISNNGGFCAMMIQNLTKTS